MKKTLLLLVAASAFCLGSCSDDDKDYGITLAGESTVALTPGVRVHIPALYSFSPSREAFELQFKVQDSSIAMLDGEYLRFASNGQTTVQVIGNGSIESPVITVVCTSPVTGINTSVSRIILKPGESILLSDCFSVEPVTASEPGLDYKVDDEQVAKIQDGYLHFVSAGTTGITAYATDGSGVSSAMVEIVCSEPIVGKDWIATASSHVPTEVPNSQTGSSFLPTPSCAIDGQAGTFWQSDVHIMSHQDEWLMLDMKSVGTVSSVTVTDNVINHTLAFDLYVSDTDQADLDADHASFVKVGSGEIGNMKVDFPAAAHGM
ncbi:MAG: discoidin domain-containing protein [Rikenellaceae bacterium]|nr:discoidin domain-containing protein [Rikenellaceae bacterium]